MEKLLWIVLALLNMFTVGCALCFAEKKRKEDPISKFWRFAEALFTIQFIAFIYPSAEYF